MRKLLALLVVNLLLSSAGFAVGPFVYELKGIPKAKSSPGCVETAHLTGQTLKNATNVNVLRSTCTREHSRSYDVAVSYESDKPLPIVTNEPGSWYAGHYASLEACNADLSNQQNFFESRTKLKAFNAYCYIDQSGLDTTIGSRIDALGLPAERPQVFTQHVSAPPANAEQLVQDLEAALKARNLTPAIVSVVRPKNGIDYTRIVMKYFGAETVTFKSKRDDFYFSTKDECETAVRGLLPLLAAEGIRPAATFCSKSSLLGRAGINFIATHDTKWYRVELAGDRSQSLSECDANRDRIVNYFKTTLKQPVFGAQCALNRDMSLSLGNRSYRAEVLLPCRSFSDKECRRPLFP